MPFTCLDRPVRPFLLALLGLFLGTGLPACAQDPDPAPSAETRTLLDALRQGELTLGLRYRFEWVEDDRFDLGGEDGFKKDAQASTLRTTLGYRTAPWHGLELAVEFENVTDLGLEDLHANAGIGRLNNRVRRRPVIADPEITETQQAYLAYTPRAGTTLYAGRQEFNFGDERFLGAVGWRQNHQAFDALRLATEALPRTAVTYAYLDRVHRIFGDSQAMQSHALHAVVDTGTVGDLTLEAYVLDYEELAALSTATYVVGLAGAQPVSAGGALHLTYDLNVGEQRDSGDNPRQVDAGYLKAELGVDRGSLRLRGGWEVLEGGPDGAFSTPLATLHAFNGWADLFLNTPSTGLEDLYLSAAGRAGKVEWLAVLHDFSAESTDLDYGRELDLRTVATLPWKQRVGAKAAYYDADRFAADTLKVWLWTSWSL